MLVMNNIDCCQECGGSELLVKTGTDGYWISCPCGKKGPYRPTVDEAIAGWNDGGLHLALKKSFRQAAGNLFLWFLTYCEKDRHRKLKEIPDLRRRCEEWMAS